jgi:predicted metal-dependent enzyme (double-stranded beta helix superfamily)
MRERCDGTAQVGHLAAVLRDYTHPREVLRDDRLDPSERRTILCFWASDACAVESRPAFRWLPGTPGPILFDHIIAALQSLDRGSHKNPGTKYRTGVTRYPSQCSHAGA